MQEGSRKEAESGKPAGAAGWHQGRGGGSIFFSGRFRAGGRQGRGPVVPPMRDGPGRAKSAAQYEYVCSPTEHKK